MTTMMVFKDDKGEFRGRNEEDQRAYARFRKDMKDAEPGELFEFSYRAPRNPKFHKFHMAMLQAVFDNQELLVQFEIFRKWVEVGAGHCDFVPGPGGKSIAIAKSIAFDKIDDIEFERHHQAVKEFLRSPQATRSLWPQTSDEDAAEGMERILGEFEREQA